MSVEELLVSFFFRLSTWLPDKEGDIAIGSWRCHVLQKSLLLREEQETTILSVRERPKGMSS